MLDNECELLGAPLGMLLTSAEHDPDRIARSVFRILESTDLCSMATRGPGARVHINTAFFAFDAELCLCFLSDPGSRHCANLERSPAMAIAIFDSHQQWGETNAGLQLFGFGGLASGAALTHAEAVYAERFSRYSELVAARGGVPGFHRLRLYRFNTASLSLLDEAEFGDAVLVNAEVSASGVNGRKHN